MARNTDEQYHALMTGKPIFDYHLSDPKPAKQIKADGDDWKDLRFWKLDKKKCRICEDHPADTLHHLVPRSLACAVRGRLAVMVWLRIGTRGRVRCSG
jgi:hypothetical protein